MGLAYTNASRPTYQTTQSLHGAFKCRRRLEGVRDFKSRGAPSRGRACARVRAQMPATLFLLSISLPNCWVRFKPGLQTAQTPDSSSPGKFTDSEFHMRSIGALADALGCPTRPESDGVSSWTFEAHWQRRWLLQNLERADTRGQKRGYRNLHRSGSSS